MSATDDAPSDMTGFPRQRRLRPLDDADVVALLYGAAPYERPDLEGAADLVTALRSLSEDVPAPSPALAALLRDGLSPGAASAPAPVDVPVVGARPGPRRALVRLAGVSLAAKVLVGTGVAFAGVAAAAGGGVLPQVVSDRFTRIVELVTPDPAPAPAEAPPLAPAPLGEDRPADEDGRPFDADVPPRAPGAGTEPPTRDRQQDGQRPGTSTDPQRPGGSDARDDEREDRDDDARTPGRERGEVAPDGTDRRGERAPEDKRPDGPRDDGRDDAPREDDADRDDDEQTDEQTDEPTDQETDEQRTEDQRTGGSAPGRLDEQVRPSGTDSGTEDAAPQHAPVEDTAQREHRVTASVQR